MELGVDDGDDTEEEVGDVGRDGGTASGDKVGGEEFIEFHDAGNGKVRDLCRERATSQGKAESVDLTVTPREGVQTERSGTISWNNHRALGVSFHNSACCGGVFMNRLHRKGLVSSLCALALVTLPIGAKEKTEIAERGIAHFEAAVPPGARIALHIRSGEIRIVGAEDGKVSVDVSGKERDKIEDLR